MLTTEKGLNTAANHGFLARDGVTTFNELIDAQQNVYGVGYGLAVVLAVLGVGLDGDPVGTEKLSIGCDANTRTSSAPATTNELGLDGHNKFEVRNAWVISETAADLLRRATLLSLATTTSWVGHLFA